MTILQRQLEIISKEEKNIVAFIEKECASIDNEIIRLKSLSKEQSNEEKINELLKKLEVISNKKKIRLLEINEWKQEVEENLESAGFQEFIQVNKKYFFSFKYFEKESNKIFIIFFNYCLLIFLFNRNQVVKT